MLIDRQNKFATDQAVTVDAISANVIDLGPLSNGNTTRDIGAGTTLYLHVLVTETFDTAGEDGTLDVTLESDSVEALSSATVHMTIPQIAEANLTAGTWIAKGLAIPASGYEQYVGLRFNVGSSFTAGKITAWLSNDRYDDTTYKNAWSTGVN